MNKDILYLISKQLNLSDLLKFIQLNKNTYTRTEIWLYKLITEFPNWKDFNLDKSLKETYSILYQLQNLQEKFKYEILDPYDEELEYSLLDLYIAPEIDLSYNLLLEIPKELGLLNNLKFLDLSHNNINTIPKEICFMYNLEALDLGINEIKEIPKEIVGMKNLTTLWLNKNQIKEIPKELAELKKLENLNLCYNKIYEIPKEIKVKNIRLFGNPLRKIYISKIIIVLFIIIILYALPHFILS